MSLIRTVFLVVMLVVVAAALSACASAAREREALSAVAPPRDFVVGLTVLTPAGQAVGEGRARQARYVIEADGVLRAATGAGVTPQVFPRRTRQLDDGQMQAVWFTIRGSSLLESDHPAAASEWAFPARPTGRTVYLFEVTAAGRQRILAIDEADARREDLLAVRRLNDRLAELAWLAP